MLTNVFFVSYKLQVEKLAVLINSASFRVVQGSNISKLLNFFLGVADSIGINSESLAYHLIALFPVWQSVAVHVPAALEIHESCSLTFFF